MRRFLIVVDMQKDFIDGPLGTPEARAIVAEVARQMVAANAQKRQIICTLDTHDPSIYLHTAEGRHLPVPHCLKETPGWALHEDIAPYAETMVEKPTFGSRALAEALARRAAPEGADLDIALVGVCTDICVVSNALLLRVWFPEAKITVYKDACAGTTVQAHEAALRVMEACQIAVV